jgi:hypothetical protein
MKKQRKHYTPEGKVAILRRHLVEGVPISELCDQLGLQPTVFCRWQKEFFENGAAVNALLTAIGRKFMASASTHSRNCTGSGCLEASQSGKFERPNHRRARGVAGHLTSRRNSLAQRTWGAALLPRRGELRASPCQFFAWKM